MFLVPNVPRKGVQHHTCIASGRFVLAGGVGKSLPFLSNTELRRQMLQLCWTPVISPVRHVRRRHASGHLATRSGVGYRTNLDTLVLFVI